MPPSSPRPPSSARWRRSFRAGSAAFALATRVRKTIRAYGDSARLFEVFAREKLGVRAVNKMTPRDPSRRSSPISSPAGSRRRASVRYRCLQQLFKWLLEEGRSRPTR